MLSEKGETLKLFNGFKFGYHKNYSNGNGVAKSSIV